MMLHVCSCSWPPSSSASSIANFITDHPPLALLDTRCATMRDLRQLHSQLIKTGLARDTIAISRALSFCVTSPSGDLDYAMLLFHHTHDQPNAFMWNTLIRSLSKSSDPYRAISLFQAMLHSPTQPQRLTYPSLFVAYAHLGLACYGAQLHGMVLKLGLAADRYIRNSMISMYAACGHVNAALLLFGECWDLFDPVSWNAMILGLAKIGDVDGARRLFDEMPDRSEVTWSSMISGYVRNARYKEALGLFHAMQESKKKPNACTLASLLGACACLGALEQGEWIHAYIEKNEIEVNQILSTAIIDMYCKCGSIDKALQVFDNIKTKGLSSWNSIISGLAMHGYGKEAIWYFSKLRSSGLRPDCVSFICILTACNHSGMVNEARYHFSLMNEYRIEPGIEHYGCLVDVLGRAGLLKEAEELVISMPMKPDTAIWGSLLSASRIHGNVDIGKRAGMQIMELNPEDSGGYVLLSNTYSNAGCVGDAMNIRTAMKSKKVRKEPGCSMIEVNGVSHEFVASGVLHPQAKDIYGVLHGLALMGRDACLWTGVCL